MKQVPNPEIKPTDSTRIGISKTHVMTGMPTAMALVLLGVRIEAALSGQQTTINLSTEIPTM
jgi:hypothetical protein